MTHFLRLRPGINKPGKDYFGGWSSFLWGRPLWGPKERRRMMTRAKAFETARQWGPTWWELVRVMRIRK